MTNTYPRLCGSVAGEASELGVRMYNAGYRALDLDYRYIAIASEDIEETFESVKNLDFRGLGVSMPFKESIIPLIDEAGGDVEEIGACNTVVFEDGRAIGKNTDWRGAFRALEETSPLDFDTAVIIGAGGVARAIAYGLKQEGKDVFISARKRGQRKELVEEMDLDGHTSIEEQAEFDAELVVNATPAAEQPESPVELDKHSSGEWLLDVVFDRKETDIIRDADEIGWKTTSGWRMLLHQALEQFELYTGREAPEEVMAEVLEESLN